MLSLLFWFVIFFNLIYFFQPNLFWSNVFPTMSGQALLMLKCFVAIIAQESLFLIVGHFVLLQITSWSKTVRALVTVVWLFFSVCTPHVRRHMASSDAWKVTLWTFLRLFSRVGHLVRLISANVIEEYPHLQHWWGFTPVCVIMCFLRSPAWVDE